MARSFTTAAQNLLKSGAIKANFLATFYLDDGTYYFCDDWRDLTDPATSITYTGASALCQCADIVSSKPYAAESLDLVLDGTRMELSGFTDPAALFREILTINLHQRKVRLSYGISAQNSQTIDLVVPVFSGKINTIRVEDTQIDMASAGSSSDIQSQSKLIITLDSLAARYQNSTYRIRAHHDQLEIDSSDNFFKFVNDTVANQRNLYWGMAGPAGTSVQRGDGGVDYSYGRRGDTGLGQFAEID